MGDIGCSDLRLPRLFPGELALAEQSYGGVQASNYDSLESNPD
jgi:hypothetical protein